VVGALRPPGHDRAAVAYLREMLESARAQGEDASPFAIIADCLGEFGVPLSTKRRLSLEAGREEWLRRLRSANRSASTNAAYRIALGDLIAFLANSRFAGAPITEKVILAYLDDYRDRTQPAEATYHRRFSLLRHFFEWFSRRSGDVDPFLDLDPPPKPCQDANWLTPSEFEHLLDAAGHPRRNRPGLAERDRLVLLTLVSTGLRRAELLAVNWGDLDLDGECPSLLVRHGKGGKSRRQPLPAALAQELRRRRGELSPTVDAPVFCGLAGKRLTTTILAAIIRRAADRSGLPKRITAHTLRHTAATWLRQRTGDSRLVAEYLGHADLSTVSRYTHVAAPELHAAAEAVAACARLESAFGPE
jgi:integrase/recombinase XerC